MQWRERFEEALARGRRPDIGFNTGGFYVRACKVAPAATAALSKSQIIKRLLLEGTTPAEVCKAIGWGRVSLPRYARLVGLALTKYEEGGSPATKACRKGRRPRRRPRGAASTRRRDQRSPAARLAVLRQH